MQPSWLSRRVAHLPTSLTPSLRVKGFLRSLRLLPAGAALTAACLHAQSSGTQFDGGRALEHVRQLVAIGPRVAGTDGAQKARDYIKSQIAALGLKTDEQMFEATTPNGRTAMINLRVLVPGGETRAGRLLITGHYDTKLFREFTFVGANDGGSSAAFLIEAARVLKDRKNALPIELVFFDGEEAVKEWTDNDHTYGSQHYVDAARREGTLKQIRALILVDMIGDRDLRLLKEANSTPWLTDTIWGAAKRLNRPAFADMATPIEDDHLPFLKAGIQAVDLIDLDYPAWHNEGDTLDKVSAESLQTVGDVLFAALPDIEQRLLK
jgi:glutaminyl-peptide cyclotransferase